MEEKDTNKDKIVELKNGVKIAYHYQNQDKVTSMTIGFKIPEATFPRKDEYVYIHNNVAFYLDPATNLVRVPIVKPEEVHLIEHLLLRQNEEQAKTIRKTATNHNGFTTPNSVCANFSCPTIHLKDITKIYADMLTNYSFNDEDVEKEKQIITHEMTMYTEKYKTEIDIENADDKDIEGLSTIYALGEKIASVISTYTPKMLKRFCESYFTKENMVIAVSTNLEYDEILPIINETIERFPSKPESKIKVELEKEYEFDTDEVILDHDDTKLTATVEFAFKMNNSLIDNLKYYYIENYFNGGFNKLFNTFREEEQLTYTPQFIVAGPYLNYKVFQVQTAPEYVGRVIYLMNEYIQNMIKNGITEEEFNEFKEYWQNNKENQLMYKKHVDSGELFQDTIEKKMTILPSTFDAVDSISLKEFNKYLKQYIDAPINVSVDGVFDDADVPRIKEITNSYRPQGIYLNKKLAMQKEQDELQDLVDMICSTEDAQERDDLINELTLVREPYIFEEEETENQNEEPVKEFTEEEQKAIETALVQLTEKLNLTEEQIKGILNILTRQSKEEVSNQYAEEDLQA